MRFSVPLCVCFSVYFCSIAFGQTITGRIIDKRSNPVANASVLLKIKNKNVFSGNDGKFLINTTAILLKNGNSTLRFNPYFNGHYLIVGNDLPQNLKIELFDMTGKRTGVAFNQLISTGAFSVPIQSLLPQNSADALYLARITKGNELHVVPFYPFCVLKSAKMPKNEKTATLAKKLVVKDSLIVSKQDYTTVSQSVNSDSTQNVGDITLKLTVDPDDLVEHKVDSLLGIMSDDEKIAQTAEVLLEIFSSSDVQSKGFGSVFNGGGSPVSPNNKDEWAKKLDEYHDAAFKSKLGIPILYGIDAVHGLATVVGATIFPHNIGMGCTGDTALVAKMANITAKECRAVGINLNFAPAISVVRDERWGRSYEGYGETPEINSMMAEAYIRGLQGFGDLSRTDAMAACAKHFIGDGGTDGGQNGGITKLSKESMAAIHFPPYQAAVKARVAAVMPSYNAWERDGQTIRCTNDKYSLTDMLKTGLNWDGFCLSDWDAVASAMPTGISGTVYDDKNVPAAINAGIDMAMVARLYAPAKDFTVPLTQYIASMQKCVVTSKTIDKSRLNDAVKRILRIKFRMNLWQTAKANATLRAEFGNEAHRDIARECVRKSLVLLKNEGNALPLKTSEKVVVVGPWANKLGAQCGGWTILWQGATDNSEIVGTTIFNGLKSIGGESNVTFDEQGNSLANAEKIVLVVGEAPYAEGSGDHGHANSLMSGDCASCDLYKDKKMSIYLADCPNAALIDKCINSNKPVIIVLISGRPMIITEQLTKCKAFVAAWLPGSEGKGVAEVLYGGNFNFTGKLTHIWPKTFDQIPINSGNTYADEKHGVGGDPLFNIGFGLTY
jgi:beta-glucosidase